MTLVSPGTEITVSDQAQYLPTAIGTVPFLLVASEQDKIFNGVVAPYTTKANAGKLLAVTSQRDLVTNFGYPLFTQSSAGTPINADELSEYGLMAGYSALGVVNRMYIIRADIDLAQLKGTAIRPTGTPANGINWLDLSNTAWGIYEWNATTQTFANKVPMVLTSAAQTFNNGGIMTPNVSIGAVGSYAVCSNDTKNPIFYKVNTNTWQQVGSTAWQDNWPAVTGNISFADPAATNTGVGGNVLVINTSTTITFPANVITLNNVVSTINGNAILGVTAAVTNNKLSLYITNASKSNGVTADGKMLISGNALAALGLTAGTYASPTLDYGTYVQVPDWRSTDAVPRPTGSVWAKTSVLGGGANFALKQYNSTSKTWVSLAAPVYNPTYTGLTTDIGSAEAAAIYGMDPTNGGLGIAAGSVFIQSDYLNNDTLTYFPMVRQTHGAMKVVGSVTTFISSAFTISNSFTVKTTVLGSATQSTYTVLITTTGNGAADFVSAVLAANIPNVVAAVESTGAISLTHSLGGTLILDNLVGTPLTTAGMTSSTAGFYSIPNATALRASNFVPLTYTYATSTPYVAPVDGTLWYYNSAVDVDIMINDFGWKGYHNVTSDARGYNLSNADPAGVILSPTTPTTQSDNTALVAGDLWINTGDLEHFPVLSRWTGTAWQLIDNADVVSQNGILFADARWDNAGTADPIVDPLPAITSLLVSNYTDLDCPDYRLYPRGTLLFNMRRSGYNVKHYVSNYFNATSFPNVVLPTQKATWVTSSGLQNNGSMFAGHKAQRSVVLKALRAAIDASETVREETFAFNLLACPGYPELIPNMVELNNDRKNTGFIIGDTPMTLPATITDLNNWSNDVGGTGLATADPYLGVYYPSGLTNDLQGNQIVVPPSHMILRAAIKSDNVSYPWFAFAGTRRGLIDNASDIGYVDANSGEWVRNGINQGLRDAMYTTAINPITILPGIGLLNFGNLTRVGTASAMDRINVARLVNYVRAMLAHVGDGFLFEPNDTITRNQFKNLVESGFNDLVAKRGIYDYLVVCDETNNTNDRIARNELYCDVAIEPMKDVEFIYIPIRLLNPGSISNLGA